MGEKVNLPDRPNRDPVRLGAPPAEVHEIKDYLSKGKKVRRRRRSGKLFPGGSGGPQAS